MSYWWDEDVHVNSRYRYLIIFYNYKTLYVDSTGTGVHIHCTMHSFKIVKEQTTF